MKLLTLVPAPPLLTLSFSGLILQSLEEKHRSICYKDALRPGLKISCTDLDAACINHQRALTLYCVIIEVSGSMQLAPLVVAAGSVFFLHNLSVCRRFGALDQKNGA